MSLFHISLLLAAFLCSLVAGFLFAFAVVIMPGIGTLRDRQFLRSFQAMDQVIQDNHPLFMIVWLGSALALIAAVFLGFSQLESLQRWLLVAGTLIYLLGVQLPTIVINVPLNNRLQTLNIDTLEDSALRDARQAFEPRWNRSNRVRTILASLVAALLIYLVQAGPSFAL